jgi:L-malate glycosyltransferase
MPARSLRIVHTVSSLKGGGMEHFVIRLADAQRRRGHRPTVIALNGGPLLDQGLARGLDVRALDQPNKMLRVLQGALAMGRLRADIVHAHNPTSLQYGVLGKLVTRGRLVFTDHAQTRGIIRVPWRVEWGQTDAVVGVSQDTADKSGAVGHARRISVIHNGVELAPARKTRAEVRAALDLGEGFVGVMVAGFDKVKGHDVLLRALGALKRRGTAVTLLVVGDGGQRPAIEALARDLELGKNELRLLGFRSDVPDLLVASDFFVLPSRDEGLPLAVLEAMARSVPVIATPVGGVPELVTDGEHGLLVPVDDSEALAAAIGRLASDRALGARLGEAAHRRVLADFSFEGMTDKYEALYASLLAGR